MIALGFAARTAPLLFVAAALLVGAAPISKAGAEPKRYAFHEDHTSIGFIVSHAGFAGVLGMFREAKGSFTFDPASGELSDLRVVVAANSVFTNHRDRDRHLRSGDFLNAREHPQIVFTGERYEKTGENTGRVHGTLSFRGVEKPVAVNVTLNKRGQHPFLDGEVIGFSGRASFKRSDFGSTYQVAEGGVGDEVQLIFEIEAVAN